MLAAASDADAGHLPIGLGTLNETKSFVDGWRFIRGERAKWKAELMSGGH